MKPINTTLLFSLIFLVNLSNGQVIKTKISGKFDFAEDGDRVQVSKPVNGYFNAFYVDKDDNGAIKNKHYDQQITLLKKGFLRLQSKDLPKFVCYAEPGTDINFEVKTEPGGNQSITFKGINAKGNELFVNRKLLNDGASDIAKVTHILEQADNAKIALDSLKSLLYIYINKLQVSFNSKEITENCYKALKAETEQRMLFFSMNILNAGKKGEADLKMSKADLALLTRQLFIDYDPFDPRYVESVSVDGTAAFKCTLMKDSADAIGRAPKKIWADYGPFFGLVDGYFTFFDHAPMVNQEFLVGNDLLLALTYKPMSDADYITVFKTYCSLFPNSPYVPVITGQLVEKITQSENNNATASREKIYYLDSVNNITNVEIPNYQSLDSLIKKQFKGKPVFVDFWATYCSPCIAEFKYARSLNNFLTKENIAILYVSIDSKGSEDYWLKSLKNYKLNGYHYFSNNAIKDSLSKVFTYIPRYMIFNNQGKLVEGDAAQPSTKEQLFKQIKTKLNLQ